MPSSAGPPGISLTGKSRAERRVIPVLTELALFERRTSGEQQALFCIGQRFVQGRIYAKMSCKPAFDGGQNRIVMIGATND